MLRVARAVEKGETKGFLKIHVEQGSERILGAALLGVGADESVHSIVDAVYARTPYPEFQRRVRIHPTVSELSRPCSRTCRHLYKGAGNRSTPFNRR